MSAIYIEDSSIRSVYNSDTGSGPRRPALTPKEKKETDALREHIRKLFEKIDNPKEA
jgi:hypothetical protein